MANKADMRYFLNLQECAGCSCGAAEYLIKCLNDYNRDNFKTMLDEMHVYEHNGDTKKHEMTEMLVNAFVTPIDREDIALISQHIDDVTDGIEEILQKFYMCKIKTLIPAAFEFANRILVCCQLMVQILDELPNFKKPALLRKGIIELNNMEEECDKLYVDAYHGLDEQCSDVLEIASWREILDKMENCADACEHVGDTIDLIVMKNS